MAIADEWGDNAYYTESIQQMDWVEPYTNPAHWSEEEDEADAYMYMAGEEEWQEEDMQESWKTFAAHIAAEKKKEGVEDLREAEELECCAMMLDSESKADCALSIDWNSIHHVFIFFDHIFSFCACAMIGIKRIVWSSISS